MKEMRAVAEWKQYIDLEAATDAEVEAFVKATLDPDATLVFDRSAFAIVQFSASPMAMAQQRSYKREGKLAWNGTGFEQISAAAFRDMLSRTDGVNDERNALVLEGVG